MDAADGGDFSTFVSPAGGTSGFLNALLSLRAHIATTLFTSQVYYHLIEAAFFLLIIYLVFTRAYKPWARNASPSLSAAEKAARLAAWTPAPLASPPTNYVTRRNFNTDPHQQASLFPSSSNTTDIDLEIESDGAGPVVKLRGHGDVLNFATTNFLGLLKDKRVETAALDVMRDYGCGACGPRGFYGTTEIHLECEAALAQFCGTPSAILYSFGAATASSTIPAFVKRGDLLVVDDAITYPLRAGARLSRARVIPFKHNDMADLRRVLQQIVDENDHHGHQSHNSTTVIQQQRRLILVEGISASVGDVCPLDEVVRLKNEFRFRLLVDESLSLGVLGHSGRGSLQEHDVQRADVEFATADLGNAFATVGGVCVGQDDVVDHQRLSGAGYCFSASQPPFLAKAATTAVQTLTKEGEDLVRKLREKVERFHREFDVRAREVRESGWCFGRDGRSPVVVFSRPGGCEWGLDKYVNVHRRCVENGVLVAPPLMPPDDPLALQQQPQQKTTNKSTTTKETETDMAYGRPSIRLSISAAHGDEQLQKAAKVVAEALIEEVRA